MANLGVVRMKRWRASPLAAHPNTETGAAVGFYGVVFYSLWELCASPIRPIGTRVHSGSRPVGEPRVHPRSMPAMEEQCSTSEISDVWGEAQRQVRGVGITTNELDQLAFNQRGRLVAERYCDSYVDDHAEVRSATKSVMAILAGAALREGRATQYRCHAW
jgi:hypothetical protein